MEEEEGTGLRNTKKQRLEFDFDKCLEDSTDEPPPEIVVLKTRNSVGDDRSPMGQKEEQPCAVLMEELRRLSERDLEDKIRRMTLRLNEGFCSKLPDKGEKFKANLRCHLEERDRRKLQSRIKATNECKWIEQTERSRHSGASAEVKEEASPSQPPFMSEFASRFIQKLETGNAPCTRVSDKEHAIVSDAFDKDLKTLGHGDRKRKQQKARFTYKGKDKNGQSWKERGKTRLLSSKMLFPHQNDLAENNERRKQKYACQGSDSDKSNNKETVVLLEEEEPDLGDTTTTIAGEVRVRGITIYYPSREDPECVEIQYKDLECLAPGEYLTSPIMNFYIRFLQGLSFAVDNAPNDYHFFNTYFYKKLQEAVLHQKTDKEASFVKFRRWWRGVNIFQKAYIFLPIHEDLHWSLAIVCIPDKADDCGPIILHLDSLGYHSSRSIFQNIRRFLREEWNSLNEENEPPDVSITNKIWKHLPRRIDERIITVPQQNNDSDCGLFVLYFMEKFIEDAPQRLRKRNLGMFGKRWFKPEEASDLRGKIKRKLMEEFHKLKGLFEPKNLPSDGDSSKKPGAPTAS